MTLVRAEHRPTLRDELAPLAPARRRAIVAGLALLAVAIAVALVIHGRTGNGIRVVRDGPVAFNLRHPSGLRAIKPGAGQWLHLERRDGGALVDAFVVAPLRLPPYSGDLGGVLPVVASRELEALKTRFPKLEPVDEGKARVNQVAGYTMAFRASRSPRLYGRVVLLPEPVPGARDGVMLTLLGTPAAGVGKADDVGVRGLLKTPYRTFRFGTEGP